MKSFEEIGVDVYELDGKTLCTKLWEDKWVLVPALIGGGFHKVKVDAQFDAENEHVYCTIQHWDNLDTVRKNWICTCILDRRGIEKADFS